jgi:glutaredoxin/glutathione-dependent peroxiredoxin
MIKVGDPIPAAEVSVMVSGSPTTYRMNDLMGSGKVVLFAVPGAFTPPCSDQHLPTFVDTASQLTDSGVDRIFCLGVNDVFVMNGWGIANNVGDAITMVADPYAAFTKAAGMEVDASFAGLGMRSMRYALVAEDGIVTALMPEDDGFSVVASTALHVLKVVIDQEKVARDAAEITDSDYFKELQQKAGSLRKGGAE